MKYGFFSKEAVIFGTSIYGTPDGKEVEVTGIGDIPNPKDPDSGYYFKDAIGVGEVTTWIRKGRKDTSGIQMMSRYKWK
jgi:hypothetical protein